MVFNEKVFYLVSLIEGGKATNKDFFQLTESISESLKKFQPERNLIQNFSSTFKKYPIENDYAVAFDSLTQSKELLEHWYQYGFVVGKDVVSSEISSNTIHKMISIAQSFDLNSEDSYLKDSQGTPILSRGFFELYHDNSLAQIRQSIRLYLHFCLIWNTPYLWTSFDRLGIKTPSGESSVGLDLHVDQNPNVHAKFTTIQGVLALEDCPVERGTFVVVPGSIDFFKDYTQFIKSGYKGEFIPLEDSYLKEYLTTYKQIIPLRKNCIVSWDSRTTHANSSNLSDINRYVCYISAGIAKENRNDLISVRKNSFISGLGENNREAYLHASKKPRFTNQEYINSIRDLEQLTPLGECLYGFKSYASLNDFTD